MHLCYPAQWDGNTSRALLLFGLDSKQTLLSLVLEGDFLLNEVIFLCAPPENVPGDEGAERSTKKKEKKISVF